MYMTSLLIISPLFLQEKEQLVELKAYLPLLVVCRAEPQLTLCTISALSLVLFLWSLIYFQVYLEENFFLTLMI